MEENKQDVKKEEVAPDHWQRRRHGGFFALILAGVLIVVLIFMVGAMAIGNHRQVTNNEGIYVGRSTSMMNFGDIRHGSRMMNGLSSNENVITGTVTSISGSTWTVAGSGKTNTITTNSSTQYQNGSQVVVNDTVEVFGTLNSNTFTANQVVINP